MYIVLKQRAKSEVQKQCFYKKTNYYLELYMQTSKKLWNVIVFICKLMK